VCCVAAPILGRGGRAAGGSISISVPDSRFTLDQLVDFVPRLLEQRSVSAATSGTTLDARRSA
jgi:DNA-binding IclR family transcriptional regulator